MNLRSILAVVSLSLGLGSGCAKKPTQDQCNALADHLSTLMTEAKLKNAGGSRVMMKKQRDRFVMVCVREGSHQAVGCMLKAGTWDELVSECTPLVR